MTAAVGRGAARALFTVLAAAAASGVAAFGLGRAVRAYWRHVQVERPRWRTFFRHFLAYAVVGFDRLLFTTGRTRGFSVTAHGAQHLRDLQAQARGGLLLGAHLGTLACLRALPAGPPLTLVVNRGNVDAINRLLARFDPARRLRVIGASGGLDTVMQVKECVARGELVTILADSTAADPRPLAVDFFGGRLRVPAAPFVLAAVLKCPVLVGFGLYRGGARYDFYCEPLLGGLHDKVVLPPGEREAALQRVAQQYADRVAHHVAMQPDNWFNFFGSSWE
jgi:predicted LPLAT superfamily acyltransferase